VAQLLSNFSKDENVLAFHVDSELESLVELWKCAARKLDVDNWTSDGDYSTILESCWVLCCCAHVVLLFLIFVCRLT
jgi:hypothetical protein